MISLTRFRGSFILLRRRVSYLPKKANYYEILGVEPNATEEEIKRAFVRKSHQLHPDRRVTSKDRRMGWRRSSDTESFMEVKEAYDCLRKPASRANYDSRLANASGYLREASHLKYNRGTVVNLSRDKDAVAYSGPRGSSLPTGNHFRDLEEEYYREKRRNRMLVVLAALTVVLILANIGYVRYLRRNQRARVSANLVADKEL